MLVDEYLKVHEDENLRYHYNDSDNHCLLKKMVDLDLSTSEDDAFNLCWECLMNTEDGKNYFEELKKFLLNVCLHFSNEL